MYQNVSAKSALNALDLVILRREDDRLIFSTGLELEGVPDWDQISGTTHTATNALASSS